MTPEQKMDKILDIFKFDKDDWVCDHENDDEIKENIIDMKANMEQLDSGHDYTQDKINDLQTEIYENNKESINKMEEILDELFKIKEKLNDLN